MTTTEPLKLLPVKPNGSTPVTAFVQRMTPEGCRCTTETVQRNSYPLSPEGDALHLLRMDEPMITMREASVSLGITTAQLCDLEHGRAVPADGWPTVWERLGRKP